MSDVKKISILLPPDLYEQVKNASFWMEQNVNKTIIRLIETGLSLETRPLKVWQSIKDITGIVPAGGDALKDAEEI